MAMKKKAGKGKPAAKRVARKPAKRVGTKKKSAGAAAKPARAAVTTAGATRAATAAVAGLAQRTCEPGQNKAAVQLRISQGETLRYEIAVNGPHGTFAIADETDAVILSDRDPQTSPGRYVRIWPGAGDTVGAGEELSHNLGLGFLGAISYTWKVTRVAGGGADGETLKNCRYERSVQTDVFFDALSIFTS